MTRGPKPKGDAPRQMVRIEVETKGGIEIRRRRTCINRHRFTTWERIGKVFTVKPSEIVSGVYA